MPEYEQSIADLLRGAMRDAQDLVRAEIALARAEMKEEGRRLAMGAALLAVAAVTALIAIVLLATAAAWGLATALQWPIWAGFAIVGGVILIAALIAGLVGRGRLVNGRHLPRTMDSMKENAEWIRQRTS